MGVKDARIARSSGLGEALLEYHQLFSCCKQSCLKARDFRIQFTILEIAERDGFFLLKMDQHLAFGNSWGNSHPLEDLLLPREGSGFLRLIFLGGANTHSEWIIEERGSGQSLNAFPGTPAHTTLRPWRVPQWPRRPRATQENSKN